MTNINHESQSNIINLPIKGLWFELDDYLRARPLPNQSGLGFPAMDEMIRAFNYRWGYQSLVGNTTVSSVFLALNHCSLLDGPHHIQLFETALMSEEGVEITGRFASIDECVDHHHQLVKELSSLKSAVNDA